MVYSKNDKSYASGAPGAGLNQPNEGRPHSGPSKAPMIKGDSSSSHPVSHKGGVGEGVNTPNSGMTHAPVKGFGQNGIVREKSHMPVGSKGEPGGIYRAGQSKITYLGGAF